MLKNLWLGNGIERWGWGSREKHPLVVITSLEQKRPKQSNTGGDQFQYLLCISIKSGCFARRLRFIIIFSAVYHLFPSQPKKEEKAQKERKKKYTKKQKKGSTSI